MAAAAMFAGGLAAVAQTNGVPAPDAYASLSQFIYDRNIFDPNRVPHYTAPGTHIVRKQAVALPSIELVGTMTYEKGPFAFFNANDEDDRKALSIGGLIAGYQVTEITANAVQLESVDKKETHELKIGDGLRQENGKWVFAQAEELPTVSGSYSSGSSSRRRRSNEYRSGGSYNSDRTTMDTGASTPTDTAPTPAPSAAEQNDVLKRLMQQREKENQ